MYLSFVGGAAGVRGSSGALSLGSEEGAARSSNFFLPLHRGGSPPRELARKLMPVHVRGK